MIQALLTSLRTENSTEEEKNVTGVVKERLMSQQLWLGSCGLVEEPSTHLGTGVPHLLTQLHGKAFVSEFYSPRYLSQA